MDLDFRQLMIMVLLIDFLTFFTQIESFTFLFLDLDFWKVKW